MANSVDLVDLTERLAIPIKRTGKTILAQCQFHEDSNPSMTFYDGSGSNRQHYHCFVCNTTADLFKLTEARKGLSFEESVLWLAKEYGINTDALTHSKKVGAAENKGISKNGFDLAEEIYKKTNEKILLHRWLHDRAFDPANPVLGDLVYASNKALVNYISASENYAEARAQLGNLEDIGLVKPDSRLDAPKPGASEGYLNLGRQFRDFFFDARIIFPIRDRDGILVGFAGRKLINESKSPKYLYTPNLPKSSVLYGSATAVRLLRGLLKPSDQYATLYVCEGLMDTLRLQALGIPAVGLLGAQVSDQQCRLLTQIARELPDGVSLRLGVFLDRDTAGLRGAANLLRKVLEADPDFRIEPVFVWPAIPAGIASGPTPKDPDEFLRSSLGSPQANETIAAWHRPAIIAILADELGLAPDEIVVDAKWELVSLSRRFQAVLSALRLVGNFWERISVVPGQKSQEIAKWYSDLIRFAKQPSGDSSEQRLIRPTSINDENARLNLARELAESGIRRGELPTDVAAWRRIDMAATTFNEGIKARLKQKKFIPMEPLDAVFVSRGFGKLQPRVKTIACPEDLIAQQYLINELLTERYDKPIGESFSGAIPAVRFDRSSNRSRTTGDGFESAEVFSFAYQIDMDVLEGRQPSGESGIFRPYFDCWKDFITSVTRQGSKMTQVYMIRLDVKRYYDELRKSVVRNSLRHSLDKAFERLANAADFAPWFAPYGQEERILAVLDWLLDQSFDTTYYHPATGEKTPSPSNEKGIPQGPVLSAWLASVALFPMDRALRDCVAEFNSADETRAGFARYVDDIVILADSAEILGALRAAAENVARSLQIELVSKEVVEPMSPEQFSRHLTEGRALATSGPIGEISLLPAGDGDLGWYSLSAAPPKRYAALQLLRDHTLYHAGSERLLDQITTALRSDDLRPSELGKAARWIWYWAADEDYAQTAEGLFKKYWKGWREVTAGVTWTLDPIQCAWDDPAFYALEGLEKVLESAHWGEESLSFEANQRRIKLVAQVALLARTNEFISLFGESTNDLTPSGWGIGVKSLRRMFWQRVLGMRWKADRLAPKKNDAAHLSLMQLESAISHFRISLRRAQITDAETCKRAPPVSSAQSGQDNKDKNNLRDAFVWLHDAFVRLGADPSLSTESGRPSPDPLLETSREIDELSARAKRSGESENTTDFLTILAELCPKGESPERTEEEYGRKDLRQTALTTFVSITPRDRVVNLLAARAHLLPPGKASKIRLIVPALPGVPTSEILALSVPSDKETTSPIETIEWFSVAFENCHDEHEKIDSSPPTLLTASPGTAPLRVELDWVPERQSQLNYASAPWNQNNPTQVLVRPSVPPSSHSQLKWVANVFDAIARLNHYQDSLNAGTEYVVTWANLTINHWFLYTGDDPIRVSLVCSPISKEKVSGIAYVRDGSRGLKSYDIPKENGAYWRVGVTLTDALGFVDELDRFSALELPSNDASDSYAPDRHLLRNVLRKLRGHYSKGEYLPRRENKPHMPATLERSLQLLRNYPETDDVGSGIAYVLACEMETRSMSRRFSQAPDLNLPGVLPDILHRISRDVSCKMPLSWAHHLPSSSGTQQASVWRAAPAAWDKLLTRIERVVDPKDISWDAYVYGLQVLIITEWLRALAFELETDLSHRKWTLSKNPEVESRWAIDSAVCCNDSSDYSYAHLVPRFTEAMHLGRSQSAFEFITPLGWLIIVAGRLGFLDDEARTPFVAWSPLDRDGIRTIAQFLSQGVSVSIDGNETEVENWPFEHFEVETTKSFDFKKLTETLAMLDWKCGLRVSNVSAAWKFEPREKQFTDEKGETWSFPAWRIAITDGAAPEEIPANGRILRKWTETRNLDGALVSVSARGKRLATLLGSQEFEVATDNNRIESSASDESEIQRDLKPIANTQESVSNQKIDTIIARESQVRNTKVDTLIAQESQALSTTIAAPVAQESRAQSTSIDAPIAQESQTQNTSIDAPIGRESQTQSTQTESGGDENKTASQKAVNDVRNRLSSLQTNCWMRRSTRSEGHIRVAIMQWNVADSYRHPIYDIPLPNFVTEKQFSNFTEKAKKAAKFARDSEYTVSWTEVAQLPSWAEFRRQRLLEQVLRCCHQFAVNLLVLPEYSVRPETIKWLRTNLIARGLDLNIIAGTYRLFGNASEPGFTETHEEILGIEDYSKHIQYRGSRADYSWERSAILTLLAPIKYQGLFHVAQFSRAKKYASNAAEECINPRKGQWEPLFSIDKLLNNLGRSIPERDGEKKEIPAAKVLELITQSKNLQCIAELVCSELFLPMSPINYSGLASEYQKLVIRFGGNIDAKEAEETVLNDVRALASHLGISVHRDSLYRRTVLVVPAMSTRSADYWCFGQAAILAGGITTVFCNAVGKKLSIGGSCFIGRKSWEFNNNIAGIQPQTPYHGWSRGIFYNSKDDALGSTEQAVVIADIDPANMNEGRPRQQSLPVPLQLVAYLPIAETVQQQGIPVQTGRHPSQAEHIAFERSQFSAITTLLERLEQPGVAGRVIDPQVLDPTKLAEKFSGLLGESTQPFLNRLHHWEKHWRDQPFAGPPPALVDWLWVDLTPEPQTHLPLVFVPPWTERDKPMQQGDNSEQAPDIGQT